MNYTFLFDLDGTLVYTDIIYVQVWNKILKKYNIFVDESFFKTNIQGQTDLYVIQKLLHHQNINIQEISDLKDSYFEEFIENIKIVEGALEFIKKMFDNNYKIGIVTNCNRKSAQLILDYCGFQNYIHHLVIGNECIKPKPYPDPYIEAMHYFNVNNNETIIFEDSKSGLLSAKSAQPLLLIGLTTIYNHHQLKDLHVDYVLEDYKNIEIDTLLQIQNKDPFKHLKKYIQNNFKEKIKHIEIFDTKLKGGYISDVLALQIIFEEKTLNCVMKIENKIVNNLSIMANKLGLYEREYYFYDSISQYVPTQIPQFYGLIKDENFNNVGILLENLNQENFSLNLDLNNEDINISLKIIEDISQLHLKFWNKNVDELFPGLKKNNDSLFNPVWNEFVKEKWPLFLKKWSFLLNEKQIEIGTNIVEHFQDIQEQLSNDNLTLIHGDVKSPNLFYKHIKENKYEPYFIDWQYICIGKGVQDLLFFMIESFEVSKLKILKDLFLHYYYVKITQNNINYDYNDYLKDIKNSVSYYPFFVALWFGTTPEEDLIDKNFPFFFIQKVFTCLEMVY